MVRKVQFGLAASLAVLAVAAHAEYSSKERPDVSAMSIKDIRVHNEGLESTDPHYISCKRYTVTGTLAKRQRICLTKADWDHRADQAQDFANQRMEGARSGGCDGCPTGG